MVLELPHISADPVDLPALVQMFHHPAAGAFVLFSGETRDHHADRPVRTLFYEAHETLASQMIATILEEAREEFGLLQGFAIHRTGEVPVGQSAVVVITAAPHREAAYSANQKIIHRIKTEVPIWKLECYVDGTESWSDGCQH